MVAGGKAECNRAVTPLQATTRSASMSRPAPQRSPLKAPASPSLTRLGPHEFTRMRRRQLNRNCRKAPACAPHCLRREIIQTQLPARHRPSEAQTPPHQPPRPLRKALERDTALRSPPTPLRPALGPTKRPHRPSRAMDTVRRSPSPESLSRPHPPAEHDSSDHIEGTSLRGPTIAFEPSTADHTGSASAKAGGLHPRWESEAAPGSSDTGCTARPRRQTL